jgi:hypothetical protein
MREALLLVSTVVLGACASATTPSCPQGQSQLDGTCVNQPVADYVSCVRARGASIDHERADKLSAEAGYAGARAATAAEANEKLERKFGATSDDNETQILRDCYALVGGAPPPATGEPAETSAIAETAAPTSTPVASAEPPPSTSTPAPPPAAAPPPPPGVNVSIPVDPTALVKPKK